MCVCQMLSESNSKADLPSQLVTSSTPRSRCPAGSVRTLQFHVNWDTTAAKAVELYAYNNLDSA
jgi:hypothetical protein